MQPTAVVTRTLLTRHTSSKSNITRSAGASQTNRSMDMGKNGVGEHVPIDVVERARHVEFRQGVERRISRIAEESDRVQPTNTATALIRLARRNRDEAGMREVECGRVTYLFRGTTGPHAGISAEPR